MTIILGDSTLSATPACWFCASRGNHQSLLPFIISTFRREQQLETLRIRGCCDYLSSKILCCRNEDVLVHSNLRTFDLDLSSARFILSSCRFPEPLQIDHYTIGKRNESSSSRHKSSRDYQRLLFSFKSITTGTNTQSMVWFRRYVPQAFDDGDCCRCVPRDAQAAANKWFLSF